jgi:tetratricopeptide (TPR) repeat protein
MLAEAEAPAPLRLYGAPTGAHPLEPLRLALTRRFEGMSRPACVEALRAALPPAEGSADDIAAWLSDGPEVGALPPAPALLRCVLAAVARGSLVLVDDFHRLDEATREVLWPREDERGPAVLAATSGSGDGGPPGETWSLDALGAGQVELLLRRWLRHPVTVRRLGPELVDRYGGWPGRCVQAVQHLGRDGYLERAPRGVVAVQWPPPWPRIPAEPPAFSAWFGELPGPGRRVVEACALQGMRVDADLLAAAASVKRRVVADLLREAGDVYPYACDGVFPEDAARQAFLDEMDPRRRRQAARRLTEAWQARPLAEDRGALDAIARLRAAMSVEGLDFLSDATRHLLRSLAPGRYPTESVLRLMAGALERLRARDAPEAELEPWLVVAADHLAAGGLREEARSLLALPPSWERASGGPSLARVWRIARLASADDEHARVRLAKALERAGPEVPAGDRADAWRCQAELHTRDGDLRRARAAWSAAIRVLPKDDRIRRADFHRRLARFAASRGRPRARSAHLRRAAALLAGLGHPHASARAWLELGREETRARRLRRGLDALGRAAGAFRDAGDLGAQAEVLYELGTTCTELAAYEKAVEVLSGALDLVCGAAGFGTLQACLHLALAQAHHGVGNLVAERRHAERASGPRAPVGVRLQAEALLARARVRAGDAEGLASLAAAEAALQEAGYEREADVARAARVDAYLRDGDAAAAHHVAAGDARDPAARLRLARLDLLAGRASKGRRALAGIASDGGVPVSVRVEAYARLAHALIRTGRHEAARAAARRAAALLEVGQRSRAEDARIHRLLAVAFRAVGERARALGHRSAARSCSPCADGESPVPRTLRRALWRLDPRSARDG